MNFQLLYVMNKNILREIGKIYRGLNSFTDILVKPLGLDKGQYQYLVRVLENPGINQQNLSTILLVDKTTCAKAINKLIKKGFINKSRDESDKRNYKLYLTEAGDEISSFLIREEEFSVKTCLKSMNKEKLKQLELQLIDIRKNAEGLYSAIKEGKKSNNLINFMEKIK